MKRIRTISQAVSEIAKMDPDTAITQYYVRCLVREGAIPHIAAGKKILIDLDVLIAHIDGQLGNTGVA